MSNYDDDITIRDETVEYILNVMNIQDPYTIHEDETDEISDEHFIKVLDKIEYVDSDNECCICLESNENDDCFGKLPCNHIFHVTCIFRWVNKNHVTCPVCRMHIFIH